jgi:hypothetical protein
MHILGGAFVPDGTFNKNSRCLRVRPIAIEAIVTTWGFLNWTRTHHQSSRNPAKRNFTFGQEGNALTLRLQTSNTSRNGMDFKWRLSSRNSHHVLVTYSGASSFAISMERLPLRQLRIIRRLAWQQLFLDFWE